MPPCQSQCPSYHSGCHKSCACWKAFQERQRLQRQAKKKYLKFYATRCAPNPSASSLPDSPAVRRGDCMPALSCHGGGKGPSPPDGGEGPSLPCFTCGACQCKCT